MDVNVGAELRPSAAMMRVAYRQAGRVMVCEILYGPHVVKHAAIGSPGGEGEVTTFSGLPLPLACRPPAGRRRGERVGVESDLLVDAHGVFSYAGIAAERIALDRGILPPVQAASPKDEGGEAPGPAWTEMTPSAPAESPAESARALGGWGPWLASARRDRDELARIARLVGQSRPADTFYVEYCEESRRLLEPAWAGVERIAEALLDRNHLMGHQVDRLVHGDDALDHPVIQP